LWPPSKRTSLPSRQLLIPTRIGASAPLSDPGERQRERGHERGVDVGRRDLAAGKLEIAGRAGVSGDAAAVAEVEGGPRGAVDAHVAHGAADQQRIDSERIEPRLQVGVTKTTREILLDHRLAFVGCQREVDLGAGRAGQEEGCAGTHRQVLQVHHRPPVVAEAGEESRGLARGGLGARQRHRAPGEVVVLQVDDQQRSGHPCLLGRMLEGAQSQPPGDRVSIAAGDRTGRPARAGRA
jgi:hypothetical protein